MKGTAILEPPALVPESGHRITKLDAGLTTENIRSTERTPGPVALVTGVLSSLLGLVVIAGWHLGYLPVIEASPGSAPMAYTTACGFLGMGLAFIAIALRRDAEARVVSAVFALLNLTILLHYLTGLPVDLGSFPILKHLQEISGKKAPMAPNTAIGMFSIALAVMLWAGSRQNVWRALCIALCGSIAAAMGLNAFAGYLSDFQTYVWLHGNPMAIHTSVGLAVLGIGTLAIAWRASCNTEADRRSWIAVVVLMAGTVTSISLWQALSVMEGPDVTVAVPFHSELPITVLVAGVLVTILLAASVYWAWTAWIRTRAAERISAELEEEVRERRHTEEALRGSEAELREAQRVARLGNWSMDLKKSRIQWSGELYRILGINPSLDPPPWPEHARIFTPESWARLDIEVDRTLCIGEPFELELEMTRTERPQSWMLVRGERVCDTGGAAIGVRGVAQDISQRKEAEAALQESETAFRTLANCMPQLVWISTPDGLVVYFSQQWVDYTGLTLEETCGRGWDRPFHPEDRQPTWDAWNHAVATGEPYRIESRLRSASGGYRWFLIRGLPVRDGAGHITKWFGTCTDIEELKLADQKLRAANEDLRRASAYTRSLIEASLDPLVTISPEGKITDVNQATEKATGLPRQTLIGTDFSDYFTEPERARAGYQHVFQEGWTRDYELEIRCRDGAIIPVLYNASLYRDDGGKTVGVFAAARNITERKLAEKEIKQLNAGLERRVTERTTELLAAIRELEMFSYSVSHDLRAPLRAMDGFSQALLEDYSDKLDFIGKDYLQRVRAASQRMDKLIDGMLVLSRTTRGEMRRTEMDLSTLAQTLVLELQKANPGRQIEFVIAPGLRVNADPTLLRTVMENLLGNAWKFTGKHPQARIEVGRLQQDGEDVYFVRDDGAGFDMAYAGKLFGAFQRLHTPEEFEGTGIGLASVQRIVHRHGGKIWAQGAVEKGATFFFTLPNKMEETHV